MSSQVLTVQAEPREEFGKSLSRRLRRSGRIPGVVYGGGGPSIPLAVDPKFILRILHSEAGHNAIFTLEIEGRAPARVMLRDWQTEPVHGDLLHVDLVRVAMDAKLKVRIPIHVTGEAQGVKLQGGVFEFILREVEVECLPDDIPDNIRVDISGLALGKSLRVSELPVGPKIRVLTDLERVVAHVITPKAEEEKPAAEVGVEAAPAEPELIRKRKPEEAEEEQAEGKAEAKPKAEAKKERESKKESK